MVTGVALMTDKLADGCGIVWCDVNSAHSLQFCFCLVFITSLSLSVSVATEIMTSVTEEYPFPSPLLKIKAMKLVRFDLKPSVAIFELEDDFEEMVKNEAKDTVPPSALSLVWRQIRKGASRARKVVQLKDHDSYIVNK